MRWVNADDTALMLAVWNDPAFVQHVGDRGIRTRDEALDAMESGAFRLYRDFGHGPFRVSLKDDDREVGLCGLFRRENLDYPDIGYSVLPDHCGKGYAYEASLAVIEHARSDLGLQKICAIISTQNEASIGLIRKLGFRFERMILMPEEDEEICLFGLELVD